MKWLLLIPPRKGLKKILGYPPIGLGYLATALCKAGQQVEIRDSVIEGWNERDLVRYINEVEPDIVGTTVFSTSLPIVKNLLEMIPRRVTTIVGGPHPTGAPQDVLDTLPANFAVRGEGEIPIQQLIEALEGKRKYKNVRGLIWKKNGVAKWNAPIEHNFIEDFNFPAWDLISPSRYFKCYNIGNWTGSIYTTRGCCFRCKFCFRLGDKLRFRSINHIWKEITFLNKNYGIVRFNIEDEGFAVNSKFVKEFCRYAIASGSNYKFSIPRGMRLNIIDNEMLELMRKARVNKVFSLGIESAVPRVRKLMNKQLTQEQIINGLRLLNRHKFRPFASFILGYPGETKEEILQTIKWATQCKHLWGGSFFPFLPYPGSETTRELMRSGELNENFDFSQLGTDDVPYAPKGMTTEELDQLRKKAVWHFYFKLRRIVRQIHPYSVIRFIRVSFPRWRK